MNKTAQQAWTGGCQCGAVRYRWIEPPQYASVCYCRMCQKASGQPFMALTGGKREHLRWTRGEPAIYRSSNMAERGFCSACGTPLTYRFEGTGNISVTMNSLDDPEAIRPTKQYGIEGKVSWCDGIGSLPAERTEDWMKAEGLSGVVNYQHPDREDASA
ncbi:MAG TPA: GFA family protein [Xanthobacteraceae bacterium]|nr:GFA family protein [Xanthobacteraceae bacterium]